MSNLSLYQLAVEFAETANILQSLDIDEQTLIDTLEGEKGDLTTKVQNYAFVVRNLRAMAELKKQAAAGLTGSSKACDARADRVEAHMLACMQIAGVQKIECPYFTIKIRSNPPSVHVFDEKQIPLAYMRMPEPPPPPPLMPNKTMIAEAIKAGFAVPGARLEQGQRLEIRV